MMGRAKVFLQLHLRPSQLLFLAQTYARARALGRSCLKSLLWALRAGLRFIFWVVRKVPGVAPLIRFLFSKMPKAKAFLAKRFRSVLREPTCSGPALLDYLCVNLVRVLFRREMVRALAFMGEQELPLAGVLTLAREKEAARALSPEAKDACLILFRQVGSLRKSEAL